jgi:hypothetical protein
MARDTLRVWMKLDHIHCYDEGDGWGSAEPYLWTIFFKVDGESVFVIDALRLSGNAVVRSTPGSHGNLGVDDVDAGDDFPVPAVLGEWNPFLSPIPVPDSIRPFVDDVGGIVGVACVLMEADNVTDDGAEAGHQALNGAVRSAMDEVIATRSFTNPDIDSAEIDQYMSDIQSRVQDAVEGEQNLFENLWSFLNPDDTIGFRVFYFKHDELAAGATIPFSQRWRNEGDWELFGHISASVACPARALAGLSETLQDLFDQASPAMKRFRDEEMSQRPGLGRWWELAERNVSQLLPMITGDSELQHSIETLMRVAQKAILGGDETIPPDDLGAVESIMNRLQHEGGRQARLDASRALAALKHLQGRTFAEAIEFLSSVAPARYPTASSDVGHLLVSDIATPASLRRPPWRQS